MSFSSFEYFLLGENDAQNVRPRNKRWNATIGVVVRHLHRSTPVATV